MKCMVNLELEPVSELRFGDFLSGFFRLRHGDGKILFADRSNQSLRAHKVREDGLISKSGFYELSSDDEIEVVDATKLNISGKWGDD